MAFDAPRSGAVTKRRRPTRFWWFALALTLASAGFVLLPGLWVLAVWSVQGDVIWLPDDVTNAQAVVLFVGGLPVMCVMWLAELGRRGAIRARGTQRRAAVLPKGSNVVALRMLSLPAHTAWLVGLGALAVALFMVPGAAPEGLADALAPWIVVGGVLVFIEGVLLGSLVKKAAWLLRVRRAGGRVPGPGRGRQFWRWFSYRWRLDLWWCGVAGGVLALVLVIVVPTDVLTRPGARFWPMVFAAAVAGMILALWSCTQFWRSGEDLSSGESVS